ncbi:MAG: ABC transporter substrate-binding protein [Deltaproteobacteria bacterium]|nr:ABC transporter substrate-binding protein [Deltaproteobacteria bacterium]
MDNKHGLPEKQRCIIALLLGFVLFFPPLVFADKWPVVSDLKGLATKYPQQLELISYERYLGKKLTFHENPLFADKINRGVLPPVEKRLPLEPLVVIPNERIGKYGGTLNGLSISYESGTSEILSWRQVNFVRFSDDNRTIVPNIVKSWKWGLDYSKITFSLRKGHRWSDGVPFTADDVVFYINDIILNKDIHEDTPTPWRDFDPRVKKIDDITVEFQFSKPFTSLLFYLGGNGSYYEPFAPKHFLKKFHIRYNPNADKEARAKGFKNWADRFRIYWNRWKDAVVNKASGLEVPTLESHVLKQAPTEKGRIFIANPYYFKIDTKGNQLPYIDFHNERFLEKKLWLGEIFKGKVDQKSQNMPLDAYPVLKEHQKTGNYTLQMPITGLGPVLFFNKTHKDPVLRKIYGKPEFNFAVSLAINRQKINDKLFLGLCSPQQALPQNIGFVTQEDKHFMASYDPDRANALLDGIGLKRGPDGFRLRPDGKPFTIFWEYTLQYVWSHEFPVLIAGFLKDVGIKVVLKEVTTKEARKKQLANELDISNEWVAPFEPTLFASPTTFMPPYGTAYPVMGIPWWKWKNSKGKLGEEPPLWVKNLWEIGEEFVTLVPGSDWYNSLGKKIIKINLANLTAIGTLSEVPLITIVSNKLANVPQWKINSFYYGYAYPYRADQWYFK